MVINRVGPLSCAKVAGTLYAVLGICVGAVFTLATLAGAFASDDSAGGFAAVLGVGAIIAFPIFYGVLGFIGSLIAAWLYNLVAGMVGGVEIETS
jgi:hypothetical protein